MPTKPGFVWNGTEWIPLWSEAAVHPFKYQATAPVSPSVGDIWIDSDTDLPVFDQTNYSTTTQMNNAIGVYQVKSTTKTDTFTTSANQTWTEITGLTINITPRYSTSKILVNLTLSGVLFRPSVNGISFRLMRNSTAIGIGDAAGNRNRTSIGGFVTASDALMTANTMFLDSPGTTSQVTYSVQCWQDSPGNPLFINRTIGDADAGAVQRSISTITVMEVAP